MQKSLNILQAAQLALNKLDAERADENDCELQPNDFRSRLLVADGGNGLHVQYDGEVWEDAFEIALTAIAQAAPDIVSLKFAGPDEGANGSRTHDFAALLATKAQFTHLQDLTIRPTDVGNHNIVDVEAGQLPALIARCPNLTELTIAHAPEAEFFNIPLNNLRYLRIGLGWQLHDFIANLTKSSLSKTSNLPQLTMLDFTDSISVFEAANNEPATPAKLADSADFFKSTGYDEAALIVMQKMVDSATAQAQSESTFDDTYTSFADYCALFASTALKKSAAFHLRNAKLSAEEFLQLNKLRHDLQFSVSLEAPHVYVSHWQGKFCKSYKHLIISR